MKDPLVLNVRSLLTLFRSRSMNYIGKVRANFVGTEFQIYDSGINYNDTGGYDSTPNTDIRQELGCVLYASNVLGSRGPRKMQVRNEQSEAKSALRRTKERPARNKQRKPRAVHAE